ncbi:DUF4294 domain-containing protein [Albibacterium bauzanense]|uniref:Uncharacterized protein DUF4294 n=1 Tax=Albibacterium bauzanense TaxID=653929 RepID=A0A4R1M0D5_9SPHI|nr:DUF4294 domain-containing protein [Albibacterium bauzanense]TCK85346.1 uncharacterized protein DUF4294 [Albibacterium bauzanense]
MKFLAFYLTFPLLFCGFVLHAQEEEERFEMPSVAMNVPTTLLDGERVPWILLRVVNIYGQRTFRTEADRLAFNRLRYNVLKVLPYARIAQQKYDQLYRDLALTGDRKEKKRLIKQCEKDIKDMFYKEIKNMTISQGEILLKLIDRQTGNTSYELVKELKGGVPAFFYQSLARVFGHNLKNEYDPVVDRDIENIIRSSDSMYRFY